MATIGSHGNQDISLEAASGYTEMGVSTAVICDFCPQESEETPSI